MDDMKELLSMDKAKGKQNNLCSLDVTYLLLICNKNIGFHLSSNSQR